MPGQFGYNATMRHSSKIAVDLAMTPQDLGWVAGLLEGEGCFQINDSSGGTAHGCARVACIMTDRDVLERLLAITKLGSINGPYRHGMKSHYKSRYQWSASGPHAYAIMVAIIPLMCQRRALDIRRIIDAYNAVIIPTYRVLHIPTGAEITVTNMRRFCRERGLNKSTFQATILSTTRNCGGYRRLT